MGDNLQKRLHEIRIKYGYSHSLPSNDYLKRPTSEYTNGDRPIFPRDECLSILCP